MEGLPWLLLPVHPAQQVVADDVDRAGLQAVFGLHHHVDAVRTQRREPASEGLRARGNTIKITLTVPTLPLPVDNSATFGRKRKKKKIVIKSTQLWDFTRR